MAMFPSPLQTNTPARRVLQKQTPVHLALVHVGALEPAVDPIAGARRLLEDAELELAAACEVGRMGCPDAAQREGAGGVEDLDEAGWKGVSVYMYIYIYIYIV